MTKPYTDRQLAILRNRHLGDNVPVPKARKKPSNEESRSQKNVIKWWAENYGRFAVPEILLYAIPNGGARDKITGARLKAEGARPGVCDLCLAVARRGCNGLYIEMKAPDGRTSGAQDEFITAVRAQGYRAVVCDSAISAVSQITQYLSP